MSQPNSQLDQWGYPIDSVVAIRADQLREALKKHARREVETPPLVPGAMFEGYLASSLDQAYSAREAFTSSSQNALTTVLACYTAGSALIFWLVTSDASPPPARLALVCFLALAAFATPWLLCNAFKSKAQAGYDLYVAACVHSAIIHNALNVPITHLWIDHVRSCHGAKGVLKKSTERVKPNFPEHDVWTFTPGKSPPKDSGESPCPSLYSIGRIVAVWRARGNNLYWYYETIFVRVSLVVAVLALGMIAFVAWAGIQRPTWIWHNSTPTPEHIGDRPLRKE